MCQHLFLQYFSTVGPSLDSNCIPWLPLSVICSPAVGVDDPTREEAVYDEESTLNALLSELGPKEENEQDIKGATPPGEAVGGLVSCLLIPGDEDSGGADLKAVAKQTVQLQRIASRCHLQIFYVTYGGQVEPDACKASPLISVSLRHFR